MAILFYEIVKIISLSLLGISLIIGIFRFKKLSSELKWFLYYLAFFSLIEIVSNVLIVVRIQNILLYPIYIYGEFLILSLLIFKKIFSKKQTYILIFILTTFFLLENMYLFFQHKNLTDSDSKILFHLIISCAVAYLLIKSIWNFEKMSLILVNYFALFFYYSISLFLFVLMSQLQEISLEKASIIWGMNNLMSSLLYCSLIYTFYKFPKYVRS